MKFLINKPIFWLDLNRNNSARELSVFAESAMAVKRVVMQHFSMNLALEARLRSLDEDSGLGHEPMDIADLVHRPLESIDADDTIQFGHLSLDGEDEEIQPAVARNSNASASAAAKKVVTFGLAPPSTGSRLAQRRLKSCLSLGALGNTIH